MTEKEREDLMAELYLIKSKIDTDISEEEKESLAKRGREIQELLGGRRNVG